MYHNITQDNIQSKGLTISLEKIEKQLNYLATHNFTTYHFSELAGLDKVDRKSVVITFDDTTKTQLMIMPLLEKYKLKASFFIPMKLVDSNAIKDQFEDSNFYMSFEDLSKLNSEFVEFGFHSYHHHNYDSLSAADRESDLQKCQELANRLSITISPVIAYPFGKYPKINGKIDPLFKQTLIKNEFNYGLKIGNRPNRFPFKNPYEIKRIDMKGEDSFLKFKIKLRIGKLKLF